MSRGKPFAHLPATLGLVMTVLLGGCATPATGPDTLAQAIASQHWTGRMALRIDTDPPQHMSGGFELKGQAEAGELQLFSPLGHTLAVAQWSASGAQLQRGNTRQTYADMDNLSQELTGTQLPLAALFDWLRGQNTPQAGWTVDLSERSQGKLSAHRTHPLPSASLRLVIQRPD